ncbi:hypothetical protein BDN70DRAFT_935242 [Pholiota conissans]|uniref:Fe2OG dioxygenase domain-containing protein n=1 Tax=Pholiota conissans TaxID=109636 RepID=A0A9P5YWW6_9AGAR|nr:hypothetical protein BDN70DRAFT_935242 [Pholiota conissans]
MFSTRIIAKQERWTPKILRLNFLNSGILQAVVHSLFKSVKRSTSDVTVELYKLNVYGPGSFFKAHVDTPRSETMFGSLVVVLPTPHNGGSLHFRHQNAEYTFDSASAVSHSSPDAPYAAFAAFFSDVAHEGLSTELQSADAVKNALTPFLSNPDLLPNGGLLAFGLSYQFPFSLPSTDLVDIGRRLKGIDATLMHVCDVLKLEPSLKALYFGDQDEGQYCFLDYFSDFSSVTIEEEPLIEYICSRDDSAIVGYTVGLDTYDRQRLDDFGAAEVLEVIWANPLNKQNYFNGPYVAQGNEACLEYAYGQVCLVVRIKPAVERA